MISHNLMSSVTIFWFLTIILVCRMPLILTWLPVISRSCCNARALIYYLKYKEGWPWYTRRDGSKRLRNPLILLWWYELLCAYAQMYSTINAYLDVCKLSMRILAKHKIHFCNIDIPSITLALSFFNNTTRSCSNYQGIICSHCNARKGLYCKVCEPATPHSLWLC